jgi:SAM-dependent methyltransferase
MTEKEFYRTYEGDNIMRELNFALVDEVCKEMNPDMNFIFEFGCGQGKHLAEIKKRNRPGINEFTGLDISFGEIIKAKANGVENLICSDDNFLLSLGDKKFTISFTCSVLCHISNENEDIDWAIDALQRISEVVIIAETQDLLPGYHWNHDYEAYGFRKISKEFISPGNGGKYFIWKWDGD